MNNRYEMMRDWVMVVIKGVMVVNGLVMSGVMVRGVVVKVRVVWKLVVILAEIVITLEPPSMPPDAPIRRSFSKGSLFQSLVLWLFNRCTVGMVNCLGHSNAAEIFF